jgi:BirA family transcriptional regulator, biotin operon repressor / biotin---[acetyl-CoA-carboxylase] ligase
VAELSAYDGTPLAELAARTGAPRVVAFCETGSTMDAAHQLARAGAEHGTVVLAEEQTAGRGRDRRPWQSARGGVWLTLIARGLDLPALTVLPLRIGIAAAEKLEGFTDQRIGLKWPNDLFLGAGKLGGVLLEARLRGEQLDWAAVGLGINLTAPEGVGAAGLGSSASRAAVVESLIPSLLAATSRSGVLSKAELAAFVSRDIARGREISAPLAGIVAGIDESGALLVESTGTIQRVVSGSLTFRGSTQFLSANS